ncbi:Transcription factor TGA like domain [Dillenia turbinata]|uniref:Transcription factor TGA like domain n=1 Tax=Dillenia turbinata TaxID=194707 RepID=A0AAN8UI83_9MAGN
MITREGAEETKEIDDTSETLKCLTLCKRDYTKREQKASATRLMKARWELEGLIEEQLNRYEVHYNRTMVPVRLKDVAQLLMPNWASPHELTAFAWLGDWRPSAVLSLLHSLTHSAFPSPSSLSNSVGMERLLSQLINDIRIEEAVLDEEMAEIQSTCILHLRPSPTDYWAGGLTLESVRSEIKKINGVITKAHQLRFKALKLVVKKVLARTDAAEFLIAFMGIQELIHEITTQNRFTKGPVSVPVKALAPA